MPQYLWYGEQEYQNMLKDCLDTIEWMKSVPKKGRKQKEERVHKCTRGLEDMTPLGQRRRIKNTMDGWRVVFQEQERQRAKGIRNATVISSKYFETSFAGLEKAFTRAIRDCREVYIEKQ